MKLLKSIGFVIILTSLFIILFSCASKKDFIEIKNDWKLLNPLDQTVESLPSITFEWEKANGADSYQVIISNVCKSCTCKDAKDTECDEDHEIGGGRNCELEKARFPSNWKYIMASSRCLEIHQTFLKIDISKDAKNITSAEEIDENTICYWEDNETCHLFVPVPTNIPESVYGYLWFVKAYNKFQIQYSSSKFNFALIDKTPTKPRKPADENICGFDPEFLWQNVGGKTHYSLEVYDNKELTGDPVIRWDNIPEESGSIDNSTRKKLDPAEYQLLNDKYYYWRIKAFIFVEFVGQIFETDWSEVASFRHFIIPPPEPKCSETPEGSTNPRPTIKWSSSKEAIGYKVTFVDATEHKPITITDANGDVVVEYPTNVGIEVDGDGWKYTVPEPGLPTGNYKWQIAGDGECPGPFIIDVLPTCKYNVIPLEIPKMTTPDETACGAGTCYSAAEFQAAFPNGFTWNEPSNWEGSISYEYMVLPEMTPEAVAAATIHSTTNTSYNPITETPTLSFTDGENYHICVRAKDAFTTSEPYCCHVRGELAAVTTLNQPKDNFWITDGFPLFEWEKAGTADIQLLYVGVTTTGIQTTPANCSNTDYFLLTYMMDPACTATTGYKYTPIYKVCPGPAGTVCSYKWGDPVDNPNPITGFTIDLYTYPYSKQFYWTVAQLDGNCISERSTTEDFTTEEPCTEPSGGTWAINPSCGGELCSTNTGQTVNWVTQQLEQIITW